MRALSAAIICALVPVSAAHAVEVPRGGPSDPRVKFVEYEEAEVYRIVGTFRTATQIVLSDDETIQHVALGDTISWEVAVAACSSSRGSVPDRPISSSPRRAEANCAAMRSS